MQRLTQTFMTLSLADVSFRVNLRSAHEAELYIRNMVYVDHPQTNISIGRVLWLYSVFDIGTSHLQIEQEEVHASLDQTAGMVSFSESPEGYDSQDMASYLHSQVCVSGKKLEKYSSVLCVCVVAAMYDT